MVEAWGDGIMNMCVILLSQVRGSQAVVFIVVTMWVLRGAGCRMDEADCQRCWALALPLLALLSRT
jgi:hypothetical protein